MQNGKKPKQKRDNVKYPALTKRVNSRVKQEYIDQDYLHLLSKEELQWLNKFMDEFTNARFNNDETDLMQTDDERKEAYDANNARNRCLYGNLKNKVGPTELLNYEEKKHLVEETESQKNDPSYLENTLIEYLDHTKDDESFE